MEKTVFILRRGSDLQDEICVSVIPDTKVHGAHMGPPESCRLQVGPMLAPWTLLSGILSIDEIVKSNIVRQNTYQSQYQYLCL